MIETTNSSCTSRIQKLQFRLCDFGVEAILFLNIHNIRYLTGFTGSEGLLLVGEEKAILLVDGRYTTQARSEVHHTDIFQYSDKMKDIEQTIQSLGLKKIGFESAFMSVDMHQNLSARLDNVYLVPMNTELRTLRAIKDEGEIAAMKQAADIASDAISALSQKIKPGWTEREAAFELEATALRAGAEQLAFETIIASGENAALPHAKPSNRIIRKGDLVVIDFGVKYLGYCSDETCTFAIGELTDDQKNAYRAVLWAHDKAIAHIQAGLAASDADALVRDALGEKYRPFFVHGTGHGVGLEVHEAPRLAPVSGDLLEEGMVVTVEPGLYYPGFWGIRIEDTVLVKKKCCEMITKMNKKLLVIE